MLACGRIVRRRRWPITYQKCFKNIHVFILTKYHMLLFPSQVSTILSIDSTLHSIFTQPHINKKKSSNSCHFILFFLILLKIKVNIPFNNMCAHNYCFYRVCPRYKGLIYFFFIIGEASFVWGEQSISRPHTYQMI